jgi:hypothetical protein
VFSGIIKQYNTSNPPENCLVEKWNVFELKLEGTKVGNPFVDITISAEFKNGDKVYHPRGFYDGNGIYKIRFMPPALGQWQFLTKSNNKDLNGIEGSFTCVSSSKSNHGPVQVHNTYHLGYADGKTYWQIGTTCYAWVHQTEMLQLRTLETLKMSPFNKLRMCVFPKSYAYNQNEPPYYPFPRTEDGINDFSRLNPEFFEHFESRIIDLMDLGIEADIILFHPYDRWGYQSMDEKTDEFYLRYVIARFAAFRNVWWSLANEYDLMESKRDYDWDRYYKIIYENDPYHHLAGIHNCYDFYDHSQPWVTHASIQSSALDRAREWRAKYKKPIIYDECRYEGNIREGWGNQSAQEMVQKFWLGTIAGCYVGHGETYQHPNDIIWWSKGGVLYGESPARIAFLKDILEDAPQDGIEPLDVFSGGKAGDYFLYYFGKQKPRKWQFDLPKNIKYKIEIIDTWNMKISDLEGSYSGQFEIDLPEKEYQAVRIRKSGYYFPIAPVQISPEQGLFYKFVDVKMWTTDDDIDIRYTLDGTVPDNQSLLYTEPIRIEKSHLLQAISFNTKNESSRLTSIRLTKAILKTPKTVENLSPGLTYKYYEGSWENLPAFDNLEIVDSGRIAQFTIEKAPQKDYIGFVYEGYIKIEAEGVFTFYCSSDDGSKMWVADSLIIENDGLHGDREKAGQIGLRSGFYPVKVQFFENEGGEVLTVSYKGPGVNKQIIPGTILFHQK